jgi:hypothetical protein
MTISFNHPTYQRFKKVYQSAVKNNIEIFVFDGHEFLTAYAKYVMEYLKPKFEN